MPRILLLSQTQKRLLLCSIILVSYISGARESIASMREAQQPMVVVHVRPQHASPARVLRAHVQETQVSTIQPSNSPAQWGTAKQLDAHTWTMNVGEDPTMATASEIFTALNAYRQRQGRGVLAWDDGLAKYAQSRTDYFVSIHNLDSHQGFKEYLDKEDGFHKLGFASLGENSSYGFKLAGVHLIEWVYAGDSQHNDNQLSSEWSYVGIGVNGTATNLIFGGKKL